MRQYQCQICGKIIEAEPEDCCAPNLLGKEKAPYHCGAPMMETID